MKQVLTAILIMVFAASLATMGTYAHFSDTETSYDNYMEMGSLDLRLGDHDESFGDVGDSVTQTWYYEGSYPPGMAPGDSLDSVVYLENIGSLEGDHLDVYCAIVSVEIGDDTDAENIAENEILITNGGGVDNDLDGLIDEDNVDGIDNDSDGLIDEDPGTTTGPVPVTAGRGVYDKDRVMIINYMKYQNDGTVDIVWADGTEWDSNYMADVDGDGKITLYDFKKHDVTDLLPPVSGLSSFSMKVTFGEVAADINEYQGDQTQMTLIFNLLQ